MRRRPPVATLASLLLAMAPQPAEADPDPEARGERAWQWTMEAWSPERQVASWELHYALVDYRPTGSSDPSWSHGSEIGLGRRATTRVLPFLAIWSTDLTLRILDSKSYALSVVQTVLAGLALGPVEIGVGGGFSTITADVIHGNWSVELFSPRARAEVALRVGSFRLALGAYGEYLWRWFGESSYLLRGLAFEVGIVQPRGASAPKSSPSE